MSPTAISRDPAVNETATRKPVLLVACLVAPIIGMSKRWPRVLHAVDMDEIIKAWPDRTVTSMCGVPRLRIMGNGDGNLAPWPPRLAGLPDEMTRCVDCQKATGNKRPRCQFTRNNRDDLVRES